MDIQTIIAYTIIALCLLFVGTRLYRSFHRKSDGRPTGCPGCPSCSGCSSCSSGHDCPSRHDRSSRH
ncbi:MAG: FeoB-associated Cys-rich membrane protein [Prevotella sp.]|nr:FeoB-associated Cys-rich membrane protein [Prevotella sp.]